MIRVLRIVFATLAFVGLTLAFTMPTACFAVYLNLIARAQLVPAILAGELVIIVVIAVSVALAGRLYCSTVCPLGIAQDLSRGILGVLHLTRKAPPGASGRLGTAVRHSVLAIFLVSAVLGFTGIVEPYGIFGRFLSSGVMRFAEPPVAVTLWAVGLFGFIVVMTVFRARWWCNQICPVGTFLGFFSRFALFRVRIDAKACVGCGACAKACDKGAIVKDGGSVTVDHSKCVVCLRCKGSCLKSALKWR